MNTNKYGHKARLTVTVDKDVLESAKKVSGRKQIPLSRLIETFLSFLAKPEVYCFKCGERFSPNETELCLKCNWMICPKCNACGCKLSKQTVVAIFHMRKVYEDLNFVVRDGKNV